MKKILSALLSVAMILSLSVPTFAQENVSTDIYSQQRIALSDIGVNTEQMNVKTLRDLNGNTFTLVETGANGYYIYDGNSDKYLEMSDSAPSPYKSYSADLYYFGPLCYYVKSGNQYVHTITRESITKTDTELANRQFASALSSVRSTASTSSTSGMMAAKGNSYIPNYGYIKNAQYPPNENGTCGYTAACLVLYYWHKVKGGIIPSTYLDSNGQLLTSGYTLQDKLLSYGSSNSSWGKTIRDVLISYCTDQGVGATSYYYIGKVGVSNSLSNGRPAILFGWLTSNPSPASVSTDSTKGKVFHAVTAYGTNGNYFICHYGWSGYSHVLLDGGIVGSCTLFQLN